MGTMYRIDLSGLPNDERQKYYQEIDQLSVDTYSTNQPGVFLSLWPDSEEISDCINLPKECTVTKC